MYGDGELELIRKAISGNLRLSPGQANALREKVVHDEIPGFLIPFVGLSVINPDLYQRLSDDKRLPTYSVYGFFPEVFELVYGSGFSPGIGLYGSGMNHRGVIAVISRPSGDIVIKARQSSWEDEVARIAVEEGVGPKQFPSIDGFITEEFIPGVLFPKMNGRANGDEMYCLGQRVGAILSALHRRNVFYNDMILADDFGNSHLMVRDGLPAVLFDYGVSLLIDHHPYYSDEEIFNYARTFPQVSMLLVNPDDSRYVGELIGHYRQVLRHSGPELIMQRDVDFVFEGLSFAALRMGNHIINPFVAGFNMTYQ